MRDAFTSTRLGITIKTSAGLRVWKKQDGKKLSLVKSVVQLFLTLLAEYG